MPNEEMQKGPTWGEWKVGISFNPGKNPKVDEIKRRAADLIDMINDLRTGESFPSSELGSEVARLKSLAMTHIEDAAMWAVKAATKE
jgi:hypothetical protein